MYPPLAQLIPLVVIFVPVALLLGLISFWDWQTKNSRKKNPLTSDLLRGPGEALREKIDDLRIDQLADLLMLLFLPLLIYAMGLSYKTFGRAPSLFLMFFYALLACISISYLFLRMYRRKKTIQNHALGLDAEIAVGQELNHLMREGYWVYHDFPAEEFNIDHIVVGPSGVFAVETKGRTKPIKKDGTAGREVIYDGETLQFPHKTEDQPLKQAESQARWLEKWLTSAVGEPVGVAPVLAIPGWFIKRTRPKGIPVINGKNPSAFFAKYANVNLSEKLQRQIVHQIDNRCRTVLPRAYPPIK